MSTTTNLNPADDRLTKLLCDISDPALMQSVVEVLLTPKERQEVDNRIQVFQKLAEHLPQREIATSLNVGIATVTRGAKVYHSAHLFKTAPDILNHL
jgi:TrpR family trp operon transcriptional repressor